MLLIGKNQLKAALTHAAKGDIRYYMNGVALDCATNGDLHLVATDGRRLFCGRIAADHVRWTGTPKVGPWTIIIPRDAVTAALKGKGLDVLLEALPNGRYTLGSVVFSPVDGTFPDWRRVARVPNELESPSTYNAEYLADAQTALRLWVGAPDSAVAFIRSYGKGAGFVTLASCRGAANNTAFCVVMPVRIDDYSFGIVFEPATNEPLACEHHGEECCKA